MIRVAIADDHQLFAQGLGDALNSQPDMRVVVMATDGRSLLEKLSSQPADVVLIDLDMPGLNGVEVLSRLPKPDRALVVSMHADSATAEAVKRSGAGGFFSKGTSLVDLAAGIRAVAGGARLMSLTAEELTAALREHLKPVLDEGAASLTEREKEILSLLANGVSSTEDLADRLFISQKTVKNHLASIFGKLAVADRTQAAIEAIRLGLTRPK
ncbi:MAG: response regulator transcription factor [Actinobacteria bacterium]|nr:response regulator transcription factor [Actinomycetota bacterium]MDQ3500183.1 response regulator transcription factor [Actinomycetota bacterium]